MDPAGTHKPAPLTQRQKTVLEMVARGMTNFEIAQQLGISLDGAKWHLRELFARLGVESREEAAEWWRHEHSTREKFTRRMRAMLPGTATRWLAFSAGSVAVVTAIAAVIIGMSGGREHDGRSSRPAEERAATTATAPVKSSDRPRVVQLSASDISNRPEVAGIRLVPAGAPALWDAQFIPQAGHSLTELAGASALARSLPFSLQTPPAGYSLDSAGIVVASEMATPAVVAGGARYVSGDSPYAVQVEIYGIQDGKVVEMNAPGSTTISSIWKYTTPDGAEVLVMSLSPGGGAEPVMEADVTRDGVYARISMPGLTLDAALAFLDDFMGG